MKYIFVDWGYIQHRAIFAYAKHKKYPATYMAINLLIKCLKHVSVNEDDVVILAVDSKKGYWRADIDPAYKANRREARAKVDVDWEYQYDEFRKILNNIEVSTNFHIIGIDKLEADDIIAYGVRKFPDNDCVIVSTDSDYEQLTVYKNTKLFTPLKMKFKVVANPHGVLAKKIHREKADNLISPIQSEADYTKRDLIVNLMRLPDFVEELVDEHLSHLPKKMWNLDLFYFHRLKSRMMEIY